MLRHEDANGRHQHARNPYHCRSAVTHDALAQAQKRANSRCKPHRDQTDRGGLLQRQMKTEHQQRNGQYAAARAGERQHQSDDGAQCKRQSRGIHGRPFRAC